MNSELTQYTAHTKRKVNAAFLSVIFFLSLGATFSPAIQAETLNLKQALNRALQGNPRIHEREQIVNIAKAKEQEKNDGDNVTFDVNVFVGLVQKKSGDLLTTDSNGQTVSRSDAHDYEGITPWYNLRLDIIKPLYSFGKTENYTAAAKENVTIKQNDVTLIKSKIKYDVYQTYYEYLTARDTRLLLEDVKGRLEKAIDLVEKWLKEGGVNAKQSDVFSLQTGTALVGHHLAESQGAENIALNRLKALTGINLSKKLDVTDKRIIPVELPKESLKKLQAKALTKRPEITQLKAGLNARRSLLKANQANIKPEIYAALLGSFATTPGRADLNNPFLADPFNHVSATPIIGLKWDWDGGRHPAKTRQAQASLIALVEKTTFARLGIPLQVAEQYQFLHSHHTMVEELAKGSRAGRRWMISSYVDFEAGLQKSEHIMAAAQGYVSAHTSYLKAVNAYNMHVIKLKSATGEL